MRPSLRFLALAVVGWAGVRVAAIGKLPGAELFRVERGEAKAAEIVPTQFPAIQPVEPSAPMLPAAYAPVEQPPPVAANAAVRYVQGAIGVPVSMRPGVVTVYQLPPPAPAPQPMLPPRPTRLAGAFPTPESAY